MKIRKSLFVALIPLLFVTFVPIQPAMGNKNGTITIDHGKGWRIESIPGTDGWLWEGGGKRGKTNSREDAEASAKKAKRELRKKTRQQRRQDRNGGVVADDMCDLPGGPDC